MTKSKSRSEVDHLRGEIKKLKKELSRKDKKKYSYEETEASDIIKEEVREKKSLGKFGCPKCSGQLDVIGGDRIKIYICQDCSYRSSVRV